MHATIRTSVLLVALALPGLSQTVYRVDASAPPGGDGSGWGSAAFQSLDDALAQAADADEVWVAAGTYRPGIPANLSDPRTARFEPADGVSLYGGFDGTESSLDQRAGLFAQTVLDGDLGTPGDPSDDAYHLVALLGNGADHRLDGFQLRGGRADGPGANMRGGAIYIVLGTKFIDHCIFKDNHAILGGAISSTGGLLFLTRCRFEGNSAANRGGALYCSFDLWTASCVFQDNQSGVGGAVYLDQSSQYPDGTPRPTFQNALFAGNTANIGGALALGTGGVTNTPGQVHLNGCTLVNNQALTRGGALSTPLPQTQLCDLRVFNSILWGNGAPTGGQISGHDSHAFVELCVVEGGWSGFSNLDVDPRFEAPSLGRYTLRADSPCIDAGDLGFAALDRNDLDGNGNFFEAVPLDLLGRRRAVDHTGIPNSSPFVPSPLDLGCCEYQN